MGTQKRVGDGANVTGEPFVASNPHKKGQMLRVISGGVTGDRHLTALRRNWLLGYVVSDVSEWLMMAHSVADASSSHSLAELSVQTVT